MLWSAQICKKCTISGNLRTVTQETKMEIRQITPFFSSTSWALTVCDTIWKLPKFIFKGSSFRPFWSGKYLNFEGVSCEIRILSRSIQETYTLRKVKNQVIFFFRVDYQICSISWATFAWSIMLFCIGLKLSFQILSPFFSECSFYWLQDFSFTFGYLFELKFSA